MKKCTAKRGRLPYKKGRLPYKKLMVWTEKMYGKKGLKIAYF